MLHKHVRKCCSVHSCCPTPDRLVICLPARNAMLAVPPGAYPLRGLAYLCSHPRLNARVGGFLAGVSALCVVGILTLALLTFRSQLHLIGQSFIGIGTAGKLVTCLLILAEATLAVYLVFKQTMQVLQKRLFLDVLHGIAPPPVHQVQHKQCDDRLHNIRKYRNLHFLTRINPRAYTACSCAASVVSRRGCACRSRSVCRPAAH